MRKIWCILYLSYNCFTFHLDLSFKNHSINITLEGKAVKNNYSKNRPNHLCLLMTATTTTLHSLPWAWRINIIMNTNFKWLQVIHDLLSHAKSMSCLCSSSSNSRVLLDLSAMRLPQALVWFTLITLVCPEALRWWRQDANMGKDQVFKSK